MLFQKFVCDRAKVGAKDTWQEHPDGRLTVPVTLTRTGVFRYKYGEIFGKKEHPDFPKSMFKDGIVNVYRSFAEVTADKSLNSMRGMFFTDEHPEVEVTTENHTTYDKGSFSTELEVREEAYSDYSIHFVDSYLTMKDAPTIKLFKSGVKDQISLGYTAYYKYCPGVFAGMTYDFEQVDIENNHGALVKFGRAGSLVKIKSRTGDLDTVFQIEDSENSDNQSENTEIDKNNENIIKNEEKKFIMDLRGVKIEFKDSNGEILIQQELDSLSNKAKDLESEVENKVKTIDSMRAQNLKLSTDLEAAKSVNHEALAEQRMETIAKAKVYLKDADFKGKSIEEIQELTVREVYKNKDLSEISAGFVKDSFKLLDEKAAPVQTGTKQKISDSFDGVKPAKITDEDSEASEAAKLIAAAYSKGAKN